MNDLKIAYRFSVIIGGAIIASLFIYVVVIEFIKSQFRPFSGFAHLYNVGTIRYIFYGLAIVQVIVIRLLRGFLLRKTPEDDLKTLIGKLQKTSLLTSALCEGPAIYGLVLFLLSGYSMDFYVLLFVSLVLMFMYFPKYHQWEAWLKKYGNPNCSFP